MIRNLGRPEAGDVAIVNVALHGLAKPAVPPAESTSHPGEKMIVHPIGTWAWARTRRAPAERRCLPSRNPHVALDAVRLLVDGSEMLHEAFLSEK